MLIAQNPPAGIYIQLYRGAIHGGERTLLRYLDALHADRIPGVVMHGGPQELTTNWDRLAQVTQERGMIPMVSWGLDSPSVSAKDKGKYIGDVLQRPNCIAGLLDAEAYWDSGRDADAITMCEEIRKVAPAKPLGDQPWFAIQVHGDPEKGGTFEGFPVDEFAMFINWGRFPQAYCNNFVKQFGKDAYERVFAWMERDWGALERQLRPQYVKDRSVTIQAYKWDLSDLVHCLLTYHVERNKSVICWSDPYPDDTTMFAIRFVTKLVAMSFAKQGVPARDAIRAFQQDYNKTAKRAITADGIAGPITLKAAGVIP